VKEIGHGFTLLPAVACVRAIGQTVGAAQGAAIKWVNDIVVGDRKMGGFIVSTQIQGQMVRDVVVGIGINIESVPDVEPTPFVPGVCCLDDFHPGMSLARFLPVLLSELSELYGLLLAGGSGPLMAEYRRYAAVVGRSVRVWPETAEDSAAHLRTVPPLAQGRVAAIADDLSLIVEGHREPVTRGRLAEEESCRRFAL
jgi:biotin-(acetyl-CoA carboxylase) ligase